MNYTFQCNIFILENNKVVYKPVKNISQTALSSCFKTTHLRNVTCTTFRKQYLK